MKLSIEKGEFQKGLARIQSIVEKRNTMPILANVLLRATKTKGKGHDSLELAATDLEVGVRGSHTAEVQTAGEITDVASVSVVSGEHIIVRTATFSNHVLDANRFRLCDWRLWQLLVGRV